MLRAGDRIAPPPQPVRAFDSAFGQRTLLERALYTAFGERTVLNITATGPNTGLWQPTGFRNPLNPTQAVPAPNLLSEPLSQVGQTMGFQGRRHEDLPGVMNFRHRLYDARLGRFLERDPAGRDFNPYAFCNNNPINNWDPMGLGWEIVTGANGQKIDVWVVNPANEEADLKALDEWVAAHNTDIPDVDKVTMVNGGESLKMNYEKGKYDWDGTRKLWFKSEKDRNAYFGPRLSYNKTIESLQHEQRLADFNNHKFKLKVYIPQLKGKLASGEEINLIPPAFVVTLSFATEEERDNAQKHVLAIGTEMRRRIADRIVFSQTGEHAFKVTDEGEIGTYSKKSPFTLPDGRQVSILLPDRKETYRLVHETSTYLGFDWESPVDMAMIALPMFGGAKKAFKGMKTLDEIDEAVKVERAIVKSEDDIKDGIIYLRRDAKGGEYIGQAESRERYIQRQLEHAKAHPNESFTFEELEVVPENSGRRLDVAEEDWIRAGGGPQSTGGRLQNARHQMAEDAYRAAGGTIDYTAK